MTPCPYCNRQMSALSLREHVVVKCRRAPAGACIPFTDEDAAAISEDDYRKMAERVARKLGWLVNHVERARGRDGRWLTPCSPGFPDDLFLHPSGTLLVVEFKRQNQRTKPELAAKQQEWLEAVAALPAGQALRGRPSTWPDLQRRLLAPAVSTPL